MFDSKYTPGNLTELGWWGWYDQGEYLKQMVRIANDGLSDSIRNSAYPPGYMLIPGLALGFSNFLGFGIDEGTIFNLYNLILCSISVTFLTICLDGKKKVYFLTFFFLLLINIDILATTFFIPWSSSISLFSAATCVYILNVAKSLVNMDLMKRYMIILIFSLSFSLLLHTRPQDFVIFSMSFSFGYLYISRFEIKAQIFKFIIPCVIVFLISECVWYFYMDGFSLGGSLYDKPKHSFFLNESTLYKISAMLIGGDSWGRLSISTFKESQFLFLLLLFTFIYGFFTKAIFPIIASILWLLIYLAFSDFGLHNFMRFLLLHYYKAVFLVLLFYFVKGFEPKLLFLASVLCLITVFLLPIKNKYSFISAAKDVYIEQKAFSSFELNSKSIEKGDIFFVSSLIENKVQDVLMHIPVLYVDGVRVEKIKDYRMYQGNKGVYIHFFKNYENVNNVSIGLNMFGILDEFDVGFYSLN
ncbi:hypothetical protein [Marinomonas foliarum]|nr:hypothetical protein [Marinomonas foliarum]